MPLIRLDSSTSIIPDVGEYFSVDVKISGAFDVASIKGEVEYNPEHIKFPTGGGSVGTFFPVNVQGRTPYSIGDRVAIELIHDGGIDKNGGTLVSLQFTVLSAVSTELTLRNFDVRDGDGQLRTTSTESPLVLDAPPTQTTDPTEPTQSNPTLPTIEPPDSLETVVQEREEHLLEVADDGWQLVQLYESDRDNGEEFPWEWESNEFELPDSYTVVSGIYVEHSDTDIDPVRVQVFSEGEIVKDRMFTPSKRNRYRMGCHARGNQLKVIVSGTGPPPSISKIDIEFY